jgi:hypothetical protein
VHAYERPKEGLSVRHFVCDFESTLIGPALQAPPPVCLSYQYDGGERHLVHVRDPRFAEVLWGAFADPGTTIIAHSASFEVVVSMAYDPEKVGLIFKALNEGRVKCTLVRDKLIAIARGDNHRGLGFGLDEVATYHGIKHTLNKANPWRVRFGELYALDIDQWPAEAVEYSLDDLIAWDIYKKQERFAEWLKDEDHQVRADVALRLMSCWGVIVDGVQCEQLLEWTKKQLDEDLKVLLAHRLVRYQKKAGVMAPVRDTKAAKVRIEAAYAALGVEHPLTKPTDKALEKDPDAVGNTSLDAEACEGSQDPVMESYARFTQANGLLRKIQRLKRAADAGMPIQASYNVLVDTGRTSCRQGDDPEPGEGYRAYGTQMQNLERQGTKVDKVDAEGNKIIDPVTGKPCQVPRPGQRECFVARGYVGKYERRLNYEERLLPGQRPDECLVSVDYDAGEMRTWAQVCLWILGYSDLADILNDDTSYAEYGGQKRCPHVEHGQRLLVARGDDLTLPQAYMLKFSDKPRFSDMRSLAKGPNFGLPGGMGPARLQNYAWVNYRVALTLEQAEQACAVWREWLSEADPYLRYISDMVGGFGRRTTITNFISDMVRGNVGYTDASNGFFQALLAVVCKRALWRVTEEMYSVRHSPLYGCRALAFPHDEIVMAAPRARVHDAGYRLAAIMLDTAKEICPDVRWSASPAAMYRWAKQAGDPVIKNGELVPYEER